MIWLKRIALWTTVIVVIGASRAGTGTVSADTQVSGKFVTRTLGDVSFHIPAGYIEPFSGYADRITLHALLPKLLPEDASNADQFHVLGWGQILRITLTLWDKSQLTGQDLVNMHLDDSKTVKKSEPDLNSLVMGTEVIGTKFVSVTDLLFAEDVFILKNSDPLFLVACVRHKDFPSPDCEVRERLGPKLLLEYSYSRNFIDRDINESRDIDAWVRELVISLLRGTANEGNEQTKKDR